MMYSRENSLQVLTSSWHCWTKAAPALIDRVLPTRGSPGTVGGNLALEPKV